MVAKAFSSAGIPVAKKPAGLCHTDRKCPGGMTLIPWKAGKPAVWDIPVTCTITASYIDSSCEASAAAEFATSRKMAKYSNLTLQHTFCPASVETLGPLNACLLFSDVGRSNSAVSDDLCKVPFLFQWISVVVQRSAAQVLSQTTSQNKSHFSVKSSFCIFSPPASLYSWV